MVHCYVKKFLHKYRGSCSHRSKHHMAVHPTRPQQLEPGTKHMMAALPSSVTVCEAVGNVTRRQDEERRKAL